MVEAKKRFNVFTGFGRRYFHLQVPALHLRKRGSSSDRNILYVSTETKGAHILEFAITDDMFVKERLILFPDLDSLGGEQRDIVKELYEMKQRVSATLFLSLRDRKKMETYIPDEIEVDEVGEARAIRIAKDFARSYFEREGIIVEPELIDLLEIVVDEDPLYILGETEKIALSFCGEQIKADQYLKNSTHRRDFEIFSIIRKVLRGNLPVGLKEFYGYLSLLEDGEVLKSLGALTWSLKRELAREKKKRMKDAIIDSIAIAAFMDAKIKGLSRLPSKEIYLNSVLEIGRTIEKGR